ncbi:hypothetical protein Moror_5555 [Moniliophthora roreri MCA 2997]|uniref:L-dopachrome isomerase n=1 Tax=Moniliophthora roreri (strain MCA 2997) TaxID=1381753 RepID=V2X5U3_MONRO|nr:hypothetical protein Moror_5555 [Moniliophthora roreri MCA 2997]
MPILRLETNVKLAADTLGVPESLFAVTIYQQQPLSFAGTFDPAFVLTVTALGAGNPGVNKRCVQAFTKYLEETLGVSNDRGYIILTNPGSSYIGYKGDTTDVTLA